MPCRSLSVEQNLKIKANVFFLNMHFFIGDIFNKFYFGMDITVIFFSENCVISPKQFTLPVLRLITVS